MSDTTGTQLRRIDLGGSVGVVVLNGNAATDYLGRHCS